MCKSEVAYPQSEEDKPDMESEKSIEFIKLMDG